LGIKADGHFSIDIMKSALRSHYALEKQDVSEVFKMLDQDGSGNLDIDEAQLAAAIIGGVLLQSSDLKFVIEMYDTDGDGLIGIEEFAAWWSNRQIKEKKKADEGKQKAAAKAEKKAAVAKAELIKVKAEEAAAAKEVKAEQAAATQTKAEEKAAAAEVKAAAAEVKAEEAAPAAKMASEPEPEREHGIIMRRGKWGVVQRKTIKRFRVEDTAGVGVDDLSKAESLEMCRKAGIIIRDEDCGSPHPNSPLYLPKHPPPAYASITRIHPNKNYAQQNSWFLRLS
jgi:Ca2+-binding EF-hand superfamily protein